MQFSNPSLGTATILCVNTDPLTPQVVSAQLAEEEMDYRLALAATALEAIAQVEAIASTGPAVSLAIANHALLDPAWLEALYSRFPQTLLVVLVSDDPGSIEAEALVPPGQLYRCLTQPWGEVDLRLTVAEALRHYRQDMQTVLATAHRQMAQLTPLNPLLDTVATEPTAIVAKARQPNLESRILAAQARLSQLQQVAIADPAGQTPLLEASIREASGSLEELQVATEELHRQNAELLATQQTLETERQRYQNLFNFAPDAYLVTDGAGLIQTINRAAETLLNVRCSRAVGKPLIIFVAKADRPLVYRQITRLAVSTQPPQPAAQSAGWLSTTALLLRDQELSIMPRAKGALTVTLSVSRECDRNGQVLRLYWLLHDISDRTRLEADRKQAEAALQQLNAELEQRVLERTQALQQAMETAQSASRAKSTFLANMSHELRTPLNAILGFAQLMARDFALGSSNRQSLEIINRSGEHLLDLINDILEMAKIEAGQVSLTPLGFDLDILLGTLGDLFYGRARSKGLALVIDCHPALPRCLYGDEPKLRQVLINLVGNALKFTPQGQVCLRIAPVQPVPQRPTSGTELAVTFAVSDTGIGIAAEHLNRLFTPFVQVSPGAGVFEGTGLGLSISQQFVQLLGGQLTVESQLGKGSTFAFTLRMQVADGVEGRQPVLPPAKIAELAPGQPSYRILVVDDDDTHRQLLTQLLASVGFEVAEARDGQEAIASWERWRPQLIWLDMRMPVLSGHEVAQQLRAQEQAAGLAPTKIIALTANAFEDDRAQALRGGCDDFVRKPFQLSCVLAKLAEHLGVQYTYDPEVTATPSAPLADADAIAALGTLPPDVFSQLYDATLKLDSERLAQLIAHLPADQSPLADLLYQHLDNFAFDIIYTLLQQVTTQ